MKKDVNDAVELVKSEIKGIEDVLNCENKPEMVEYFFSV